MADSTISSFIAQKQVAYLFPELDADFIIKNNLAFSAAEGSLFVFQYWPAQLNDSYEVDYAEKVIPGGSHPLYQYVAGRGRTLSFDAEFTSEVEDTLIPAGSLLPSSRYTVDVDAALNFLQSLQYPTYGNGLQTTTTFPPPKLNLVFPGSRIGRGAFRDSILCLLKGMRIVTEAWFPSGKTRYAKVSLDFIEVVQLSGTASQTIPSVQFISRSSFTDIGDYRYRGALAL